jgi:RNA polymerase sigma factor (sigma-70 family)
VTEQPMTLEDIARRAVDGDREALDGLVRGLQDDIYGLSLRMLWNREDAEDATQEILVRTVTRLSQFDFRSKLKTWVYRIAVNYILDVKKSAVERLHLTFERFADDLLDGLSSEGPADAERSMLTEEVKVGCTLAMLQCLDRPHRLAYVLGEIFDLPGPEAAEALTISPELFRKRLQHARTAIESFTRAYCGLASDTAACACHRRVPAALRIGRVRGDALDFAATASSFQETRELIRQVEVARRALEVHRTSQPRGASVDFARRLAQAIDSAPSSPQDSRSTVDRHGRPPDRSRP